MIASGRSSFWIRALLPCGPATNRILGAGTEMNKPSSEGRFAGGVFTGVLQPLTGGECVPGFPTGIQGEVIAFCLKRACVRKTAIRVVVRCSGRDSGQVRDLRGVDSLFQATGGRGLQVLR